MSITLEQQLALRPVDPVELDQQVHQLRQQVQAWRLREVREAQALTQVEVAEELGVGQNRVSAIEKGNLDHSQISTLRRYVEALGGTLTIEAAFGGTHYVLT